MARLGDGGDARGHLNIVQDSLLAGAAFMSRKDEMAKRSDPWLAYCGRNSLVIYLSFFLPMAAARIALIRTGWIADTGAMSALVAAAAIAGPLALRALVRGTPLNFLYIRPSWARLEPRRRAEAEAPVHAS